MVGEGGVVRLVPPSRDPDRSSVSKRSFFAIGLLRVGDEPNSSTPNQLDTDDGMQFNNELLRTTNADDGTADGCLTLAFLSLASGVVSPFTNGLCASRRVPRLQCVQLWYLTLL